MWSRLADWILDHALPISLLLAALTGVFAYWAAQIRTDHTAGHFLSSDSEVVQNFRRASAVFGQSQTVLYLVWQGVDPADPAFLAQLDAFTDSLAARPGVQHVLSLANVPYLVRSTDGLTTQPLYDPDLGDEAMRARLEGQPFLRGVLLSHDGTMPAMLISIEEAFNDTPERVHLVNHIREAGEALPGDLAMAGFPYLRTQYAERVTDEAPLFTPSS